MYPRLSELASKLRGIARYLLLTDSSDIEYLVEKPSLEGFAMLIDLETEECYLLQPLRSPETIDCAKIVKYSLRPEDTSATYIAVENFKNALLSFVKGFVEPKSTIALRYDRTPTSIYATLSQLWKVIDVSRELNRFRARKPEHVLSSIESAALRAIEVIRRIDACRDLDCVATVIASVIASGIMLDLPSCYIRSDENKTSLRIVVAERQLFRGAASTTILFGNHHADAIRAKLESTLIQVMNTVTPGTPCISLVERLENAVRALGFSNPRVEICGLGTSFCEYPTLSDMLAEDCVLDSGLALYIEVGLRIDSTELVIGRTAVLREGRARIVGAQR